MTKQQPREAPALLRRIAMTVPAGYGPPLTGEIIMFNEVHGVAVTTSPMCEVVPFGSSDGNRYTFIAAMDDATCQILPHVPGVHLVADVH